MRSEAILSAVTGVTKGWAKQRKAEERGSRRARVYYYSDRVNFSDCADAILPAAYAHASGNGQYTVSKRQLYYASRDKFLEMTERELDYQYFAQTLLVQYLNRNPDLGWKITADPRGTFTLPNASHEVRVPVGTLRIDEYLAKRHDVSAIGTFPIQWPSEAEHQRYAAVLYIEKEGFEPILREARIAERFDLGILSCKGQSVVAARRLVDTVCAVNSGVPLFVVHDFDKPGFEIAERLTTESEWAVDQDRVAYRFDNEINVVDFGLRLKDVEKYNLASEKCKLKGRPPTWLTSAEHAFLSARKRVELNAFTAPQFVDWLESKLSKHLPQRLIPGDDVLARAYLRALRVRRINQAIEDICDGEVEVDIPKGIRQKVKAKIKATGEPWDVCLHRVIEDMDDD